MSKIEAKKSTTIAINIADSILVEEYCKAHNILKKDFVGLAVRWFKDNDVDIRSEVSFVPVPAETQANQNNEVKALCTLMAEFITAQKQLPSRDDHGLIASFQDQIAKKDAELAQIRTEREQTAILLEKARNELRRLKKGLFSRPDSDVMNELGIY
jgi:septal ring factor EnvC (AmiA/AmiB activator)